MRPYKEVRELLRRDPHVWLVTGVAGFIGSNLLEQLLRLGQTVVGLDNFATGRQENLDEVLTSLGEGAATQFRFIEGDICDYRTCREACDGVDYVLHQAALGSVPRSLDDPIATNQANVVGFLNMIVAARDAGVKRLVYAASSATYGDHPRLPKVEHDIGRPLSPYAVTKYIGELYADVFQQCYGMASTGLRYFNVFGRRQDPSGSYAAVIPKWVGNLIAGETCHIYGDGETSRDFCYIDNVLQANLLAAMEGGEQDGHQVYNVACGESTSLNQIFFMIRDGLARHMPELAQVGPVYKDFRAGDVRHSKADISKIRRQLGYKSTHTVEQGLKATLKWYIDRVNDANAVSSSGIEMRRFTITAAGQQIS